MNKMKKFLSVLLVVVMVFAMSATAFADDTYSITINEAADGETYSAYKIFDATYTTVVTGQDENGNDVSETLTSYTIEYGSTFYNAVVNSGLFTVTQVGESTTYTVVLKDSATSGETILSALSGVDLTDVTASGTAIAANDTATISLTEPGYYYVTTTLGSVVALDSANPTATIAEKNATPTVEKKVKEDSKLGDSTNGWEDTSTADIGETVYFKSVIDNYDNLTSLTYYDTMESGLTFNNTSVVVTSGSTTLEAGTDYILNTSVEGYTFTITFTETGLRKAAKGDDLDANIVVAYSATVNENASIGYTDGNDNTAKIGYGNSSVVYNSLCKVQ